MVLNYFSPDFCPSLFITVFHCLTPCLPSWNHDNAVAAAVQILPFPLFNYNVSGTLYPILYHCNPDFILRRSSSREPWAQIFSLCFLALKGKALLEVHKQMFGFFLLFSQHLHHPAKNRMLLFHSSFLTNSIRHFCCLLKESYQWAYAFSFCTI